MRFVKLVLRGSRSCPLQQQYAPTHDASTNTTCVSRARRERCLNRYSDGLIDGKALLGCLLGKQVSMAHCQQSHELTEEDVEVQRTQLRHALQQAQSFQLNAQLPQYDRDADVRLYTRNTPSRSSFGTFEQDSPISLREKYSLSRTRSAVRGVQRGSAVSLANAFKRRASVLCS